MIGCSLSTPSFSLDGKNIEVRAKQLFQWFFAMSGNASFFRICPYPLMLQKLENDSSELRMHISLIC